MIDRFLHVRQQDRGVCVVDLAVGEHVALASVEQAAGILPIHRAVEEVEHESLHVLGGINPETVDADHLHEPLRVAHQIAGGILEHRVAGGRVLQVEAVDRDAGFVRHRVGDENRLVTDVGIETPVPGAGHVGEAAEGRRRPGRHVAGIAGCHRASNEAVVFFMSDVNQPREPLELRAAGEGRMKVAVDIPRTRQHETRITAGRPEPGRAHVREAVVVHHEVDVQAQPGAVNQAPERLQALFRAIQRRPARPSQIESVVDVVSNAEVALVGAERRREPDKPVAGDKDVRHARLDGSIRGLEPLENRRGRFIDPGRRAHPVTGQQNRDRRDCDREPPRAANGHATAEARRRSDRTAARRG